MRTGSYDEFCMRFLCLTLIPSIVSCGFMSQNGNACMMFDGFTITTNKIGNKKRRLCLCVSLYFQWVIYQDSTVSRCSRTLT